MKKIFTLFIILSFLSHGSFAQRLLTEDFNYAAGQLTDANGGANVSGGKWVSFSGTGFYIPVVDGSLSYAGYVTNPAAGSRKISLVSTSSSAEDAYTEFTAQTSGTVYSSFLISVDSTANLYADTSSKGEYFAAFLPSTSTTNYVGRIVIRKGLTDNTFNLGVLAQSTTGIAAGWAAKDLVPGTTYLVTFAYEFVAGANNDVAKIWINEANSPTEPTADATSAFATGTEPADIGRIAFRQASKNTPSCNIDAIKVSTSWADGTLPVTLTSFTASLVNTHASLSWTTANEINMKEYSVERSADGISYKTIATVAAKTSSNKNTYSYTDAQAISGTLWYRIKLMDKDGSYTYSNSKLLSAKQTSALIIQQNPVKSNLVLNHEQTTDNSYMQIITAGGVSVIKQKLQTGVTQTTINVSTLKNGVYYVVFVNGTDKTANKFVKQ